MPISEALRAELGQYLIGPKLRALRLRRSMGLTQLGQRTGLSPALLSKIENAKLVPTIPTLLRMARVFDVTLDYFFQNEHRRRIIAVTRQQEREKAGEERLGTGEGFQLLRLDLGAGERKFHAYMAEFPATGEAGRGHMHQGFEFVHVLGGRLELVIGSDVTVLETGDSIYFDSNLRHGYRSLDQQACTAFMVLAYPERNLTERRMDNLTALHGTRKPAILNRANGNVPVMESATTNGESSPVSGDSA